jgi:hypothetical protein
VGHECAAAFLTGGLSEFAVFITTRFCCRLETRMVGNNEDFVTELIMD